MDMHITGFSIAGIIVVFLLLAMAVALYWLVDKRLFSRLPRVLALAVAQLVGVGAYVWLLQHVDRWWAYFLWFLLMVAATALLCLRQARLKWQQQLPTTFVAVLAGGGLLTAVLMLCLSGRLLVPVVGVMMGQLLASVSQALQTYHSSLLHTEDHRRFLLANGATRLESLMPSVRRGLRAAVLPLLCELSSPLLVAMPVLLCGLLLGGVNIVAAVALVALLWAASLAASVLAVVVAISLYDWHPFSKQLPK